MQHAMHKFPRDVIERILVHAIMLDVRGTDPLPLLRVAPGLSNLRRTVLRYSLHARLQRALEPPRAVLRGKLLEHCGPSPDLDQSAFYLSLLVASNRKDLMEAWNKRKLDGTCLALVDVASAAGRVGVLKYLHSRKLIKKSNYTERAIDDAAAAGHLAILRWWEQSGLPRKATERAFFGAVESNDPAVLDKVHELDLDAIVRFEDGMDLPLYALEIGSFRIIDEWSGQNESGGWTRELDWGAYIPGELSCGKLSAAAFDWQYRVVSIEYLHPYLQHGYNLDLRCKYERDATSREPPIKLPLVDRAVEFWRYVVMCATEANAVAVLDWAAATLPAQYVVCPAGWMCVNGKDDDEAAVLARLQWWKDSEIPLKLDFCDRAVADAAELGFDGVVAWWRDSGLGSRA
ncbi:hypothetical protein H9P43_004612 [Blastocladiella emersonii ATCC 22665]|nr:hypothetical protein H9P43_004612 [Blastocladiella emersonii ATCC 22665]